MAGLRGGQAVRADHASPRDFLPGHNFWQAQARIVAQAIEGHSLEHILDDAARLIGELIPQAKTVIEISSRDSHSGVRVGTIHGPEFGLDADPVSILRAASDGGAPVCVRSLARGGRWVGHGLRAVAAGFLSGIACPILTRGDEAPVGALAVYLPTEDGFSDELCDKLESLSSIIGQAWHVIGTRAGTRNANDRFSELAATIPGVVYQRVVRPDGDIRYTYMSNGAKDLFGVDAETILRDPEALFSNYGPEYRATFRQRLIDASMAMKPWDVEAQIVRKDGSTRYTHAIAHPRREADGSVMWTGVILDATRMKLAEIAAAEAESRTRQAIVEGFAQGLLLFDEQDKLIVTNSKFFTINPGMEQVAVSGASYTDVLMAELDPGRPGQITESDATFEFCERLAKHNKKQDFVFERRIAGDRWILIHDNRTASGGKVVFYTDVTELKRRELHVEHLAHHDALTGLANRVLFRKKLEELLDHAEQEESQVAVIFIDLDRFKAVNDTLGHPIGDALLQIISARIKQCIDAEDIPARLGGDEFALIVPRGASTENLTSLAWRLIDQLSRPAEIAGHTVVVGASLGIAIGHEGATSADYLLKSADLALYRAKQDGKGTFRFFEAEMDAVAQQRRQLEMDLRLAIREHELQVYYQPQVDVFTAQIVGAEALLRWFHPKRGAVPPMEFIPLAEETGLISEIGPYVLRRACMDAVNWPLPARVAVNVSPAQFQSGKFIDQVRQALEESGLKPQRLEIEITESLLLRNTDANIKALWELKSLGVRVSMDDFGTGYSSLGNLRSFPFDKIKIDRSFISDLKNSADAAAIIRAVVSLGRSLGITTTAEGVETRDQLTYLRAEGCTEVQGYYYSEACPAEEIHALLAGSPSGIIMPR